MRPRRLIGYASASSEPLTLLLLDWEMPAPKRARKNRKMLVANPVANTIRPNTTVAQPMIGARRNRSASQPIGTMPRTRKPPEMPATNVIAPVLTWNEDWMLGARTASPELCRLSRVTMTARITKVLAPALRRPSRSDIASSPTPGSRSSGRRISFSEAVARWRSSAESATRCASSDGLRRAEGPGPGSPWAGGSLKAAPISLRQRRMPSAQAGLAIPLRPGALISSTRTPAPWSVRSGCTRAPAPDRWHRAGRVRRTRLRPTPGRSHS